MYVRVYNNIMVVMREEPAKKQEPNERQDNQTQNTQII